MAKKSPIEVELLEAAEISGAKEGESRTKYLTRLMKAVQELPDKEWDKLTDEAQDWVNASQAAINKKKEPEDFPDAAADKDDEDDRPRRRAAKDEDEDDKPSRKPSKDEDDEDEDRPRRKAKDEDDEDEDKPARKASKEDDEDEDKPRRRRSSEDDEGDKPARSKAKDEDDEGDKPRRRSREQSSDDDKDDKPAKKENGGEKKGGVAAILGMVTENMDWSKEKVLKKIVAEGYDISEATVGIQYSTAHRIMKLLHEAGHLEGYPAAGDKD